jgi:hypothetical protein
MKLAAKFREMANNDDGWRRMQLLQVVQQLETQARRLKEQSGSSPSNMA